MNVYLDYAATAPLSGEVLEKMLPLFKENFANPSSLHAYGRRAAYAVSEARDRVAAVLGVHPLEVYFTSGGTEADNWALSCMGEGDLCVSAIEHSAALEAAKAVRNATFIAPNQDGIVTAERVKEALTADMGLVCVMAVNNETGSIQPVREISALCKEKGVLFFSDCVQAALPCDLKELASLCDGLSLSAHKVYGPKGTGALVVKKSVKLRPLIRGGEQERSLRGGTLNAAGIVGFSYALESAQREREAFCAHTGRLRDLFEEKVKASLGERVQIDGTNRVPNISHLTVQGGEALLHKLDLAGVAASGGAACSAHSALPSHVLLAMGRSEEEAKHGIRFSFGKDTSEEEVLFAAQALIDCCKA